MNASPAESLAKEVLAGTYAPAQLDDCKPGLPLDRNLHVVRFVQFFLIANPALDLKWSKESEYLILQQHRLAGDASSSDKAIVDRVVTPIARAITDDVLRGTYPDGTDGRIYDHLPDPADKKVGVDRIRAVALSGAMPGYQPSMAEAELRRDYASWATEIVQERLLDAIEPLERSGFLMKASPASEFKITPVFIQGVLADHLKNVLLPAPYQPFANPHPHVAFCVTFEQIWEPKGYTRGELINTISLAPGEQLTLEVHSWDKTTFKSEEELATESEMRVSENLTERDVKTVTRQVSTDFNVKGEVPLKVGKISGGADLKTGMTNSLEQTRERTVQASNAIKNSRKLKIEVSREVGREQKQTRVISNTNRCHTLNCQYFEIISNYLVTTQLASVQPCLLMPNTRFKVTAAWVLCHQDILTQALLDKTFLPGFQAAKVLETEIRYREIKKEEAKASGVVADPVQAELQTHVDAIVASYKSIRNALDSVISAAKGPKDPIFHVHIPLWGTALAVYVTMKCGVTKIRRMLYMAMLQANPVAVNALKKLGADSTAKPSVALKAFFSAVTPRDYQYNAVNATVANALDAIGIPGKLVDALLQFNIFSWVDFAADDAGLYNDVKAAGDALDAAWGLPPETTPGPVAEGFTTMEVAEARVVFEQLACHIEDNWVHYLQAVLQHEHPDQRFLRLQRHGAVAAVLDNDLLGFLGHKSAYPINDLKPLSKAITIDLEEMLKDVSIPAGDPQLVSVPTQGTVLEAMVGQCDACEEFIHISRDLDLRTQEAKARQEEAEADRRQARLDAEPPDLSDPRATSAGTVTVNVGEKADPAPGG